VEKGQKIGTMGNIGRYFGTLYILKCAVTMLSKTHYNIYKVLIMKKIFSRFYLLHAKMFVAFNSMDNGIKRTYQVNNVLILLNKIGVLLCAVKVSFHRSI
jgi:hypothetical protein